MFKLRWKVYDLALKNDCKKSLDLTNVVKLFYYNVGCDKHDFDEIPEAPKKIVPNNGITLVAWFNVSGKLG